MESIREKLARAAKGLKPKQTQTIEKINGVYICLYKTENKTYKIHTYPRVGTKLNLRIEFSNPKDLDVIYELKVQEISEKYGSSES